VGIVLTLENKDDAAGAGGPSHTHQQPARQMPEEVDYLGDADGAAIRPEVQASRDNPVGGQQHVPAEVILEQRSLSARHPLGPFAQSALVDEDDGSPFAERFLLIWASGTSSMPRDDLDEH
jgi:hypothetical protein